jgi:hypothetical protein
VLTYRATIPLSTRTLTRLTELLRARRRAIGSRWRRLEPDQQALLVLAHLRNGDTRDRLAGGFDISATTVWRYIREAVDLLTAAAPTLDQATRRIGCARSPVHWTPCYGCWPRTGTARVRSAATATASCA